MTFQLTIEPLGRCIEVDDGQTILDACLREGIWLPHACCHGLCATCKVQVTDGDIDHGDASPFALMEFEREEGKTLACCARLESDIVIEADIDDDPDAQYIPLRDFSGVVTRVEALTPTIKGVFIRVDEPMRFQAGQYVTLGIGELEISRAFSLANPPSASEEIELNVRIVPGGQGTTWIHEQLAPGERVKLIGPYGNFFVRKSADRPLIFMAGGSGLSSPRSMIHDLVENGFDHAITLIYGQRSRAELYYHDEFLALAEQYKNFHYFPALSHEEAGSGWSGYRGFVHEAANQCFGGDFRGHQAYLCGPPLMIDSCVTVLMQGRLFEKDIYFEKFISAADAQQVRSPLFRKI